MALDRIPACAAHCEPKLFRWRRACLGILVASPALTPARAQSPTPPETSPVAWVEAAAANEIAIINDDGSHPLRYRTRKVDKKGDTTREVIEAHEGSVARLIEQNGQPLSPAEDTAEKARLQATLASPSDFIKHHKHDASMRSTIVGVVRLMPRAMLWTYTPGQPQVAGSPQQIVLDFKPDPNFKPPTIASELLTGIEGRVWIDRKTQHLVRAEAHVLRPLDIGWGMLVRVYPGGSAELEQQDAGNGHWTYSKIVEHLTVREMIFRNSAQDVVSTSYDFQLLPSAISFQDAIRVLLAMPVALR